MKNILTLVAIYLVILCFLQILTLTDMKAYMFHINFGVLIIFTPLYNYLYKAKFLDTIGYLMLIMTFFIFFI